MSVLATMREDLSVLVVHSELVGREGLRAVLDQAGVQVVARASIDGCDSPPVPPDVVVVGGALLRCERGVDELRKTFPDSGLVLLLRRQLGVPLADVLAGGSSLLSEPDVRDPSQVLRAVDSAWRREIWVDTALKAVVARANAPPNLHTRLTMRELEVLALMAQAHTNESIASQLVVSGRAVEKHVHNIYRKLSIAGSHHRRVASVLRFLDDPEPLSGAAGVPRW